MTHSGHTLFASLGLPITECHVNEACDDEVKLIIFYYQLLLMLQVLIIHDKRIEKYALFAWTKKDVMFGINELDLLLSCANSRPELGAD